MVRSWPLPAQAVSETGGTCLMTSPLSTIAVAWIDTFSICNISDAEVANGRDG